MNTDCTLVTPTLILLICSMKPKMEDINVYRRNRGLILYRATFFMYKIINIMRTNSVKTRRRLYKRREDRTWEGALSRKLGMDVYALFSYVCSKRETKSSLFI